VKHNKFFLDIWQTINLQVQRTVNFQMLKK
jgi:hypothetical protein